MKKKFPYIEQPDMMDCGPACLSMIAAYYGKNYPINILRSFTFTGKDGVSLLGISKAAETIGFRTIGGRVTFDTFTEKKPFPCIVHWQQEHFVVVYKMRNDNKGVPIVYVAVLLTQYAGTGGYCYRRYFAFGTIDFAGKKSVERKPFIATRLKKQTHENYLFLYVCNSK